MSSKRVEILRGADVPAEKRHARLEIKDPSILQAPDGSYVMFASSGFSDAGDWVIGRYRAAHPGGPWEELPPAVVTGVTGPEVCAPAVVISEKDGKPFWEMYVQTTCFSADGVIAYASSADGRHFTAGPPAMRRQDVPAGPHPVISLYDVAVSEITRDGKKFDCMVFSAYRDIGSGDVYMALREKGAAVWGKPVLALAQEDVPFHNRPGSANFEWGLEGAKIVELAPDAYLMIGVCFLDKDKSARGTRQRVFFAASATPEGPFTPLRTPIDPTAYPEGTGENGHPDTVDLGDRLGILYQERAGEGEAFPWHLRYTEMQKDALLAEVRAALKKPAALPHSAVMAPQRDWKPPKAA